MAALALPVESIAAEPLAVAMGDPAGIGPEVIAKAWAARSQEALAPFFAVGDSRAVSQVWTGPIVRITDPREAAAAFPHALPVLDVEDGGDITPGQPDVDGARCALHALELAVGLVRSGAARALVTGPVSKAQLYQIGFTYPGQTEFVAERCGIAGENAVMMLAGPTLRVVPITTHVPLSAVSAMLSVELLVAKGRATARGLSRNFGILAPRLAFAGFNPHAGENGALGREEIDIIAPAIAELRAEGINATGPFAADTMFHPRARATFDAALCCYHDQALVPLKTLHFDEGVNITLGLPIVRTSPDHGTAFNIAGKDMAEPGATIARSGLPPVLPHAAPPPPRWERDDGLPPLRDVIARHGLAASKALGQNFLLDEQLLAKIARIPGDLQGAEVFEVGPGPGGLTRALLAAGASVTAVERDHRCIPALAELGEAYPGRLRVIEGDAMEIDPAAIFTGKPHIVSNLPYNIGTALLVRWLSAEWLPWWASLTLMFQKEVADRIVARTDDDAYGRLAVLCQWRSTAKLAMPVHRAAFTPPPKVMSAVVYLTPLPAPEGVAFNVLERLTGAAFGQRRKMLRQSLKGIPGALAALDQLGIEATRRAETVSVAEFVAAARLLSPQG